MGGFVRTMARRMLHRNIFLTAFETPESGRKSAQCLMFFRRPITIMRIVPRM
jgi:hypothetical protein